MHCVLLSWRTRVCLGTRQCSSVTSTRKDIDMSWQGWQRSQNLTRSSPAVLYIGCKAREAIEDLQNIIFTRHCKVQEIMVNYRGQPCGLTSWP